MNYLFRVEVKNSPVHHPTLIFEYFHGSTLALGVIKSAPFSAFKAHVWS